MNRFFLFIVATSLLAGCSNSEDSSPFSEILAQPPFKSITDSIHNDPKNDSLFFRRAVLLNSNNFPEPALADFQKAWSLKKVDMYAIGASNLLLAKKPEEAVSFLKDALRELPNSLLLRLSLVHAYDEAGQIDNAITECNSILRDSPNQVNALFVMTDLMLKKGDSTGVTKTLEQTHYLAPANMDISLKLAYQYAETKNPKAVAFTDSLIARDTLKLHADPFYVRGLYYSNIGEKEKAIEWFNQTIKREYNYLNAYVEKGKVILSQKKPADAYKVFGLANTIDPAFADAWYWMAKCQEEMDLKEEAKLNYEKAYSLDKTFIEAKEAADAIK